MKDYFSILQFQVGTNGNAGNKAETFNHKVPTSGDRAGNTGNKTRYLAEPVPVVPSSENTNGNSTPQANSRVPSIPTSSQLKYQESKKIDYWHDYHERAGIHEYEGNIPKEEAERLAYQSTLVDYCRNLHPEIVAAYESCIYQPIAN